ncbi:MAG: hypothetical protein F6K09_20410 [Merismopedia sp. SIO2A8]|nr:hypothetical protein [Symploca sp. SIO2B6]NET51000.1 hypothetical protein [Merismopedia sp. SIO2A8]
MLLVFKWTITVGTRLLQIIDNGMEVLRMVGKYRDLGQVFDKSWRSRKPVI